MLVGGEAKVGGEVREMVVEHGADRRVRAVDKHGCAVEQPIGSYKRVGSGLIVSAIHVDLRISRIRLLTAQHCSIEVVLRKVVEVPVRESVVGRSELDE